MARRQHGVEFLSETEYYFDMSLGDRRKEQWEEAVKPLGKGEEAAESSKIREAGSLDALYGVLREMGGVSVGKTHSPEALSSAIQRVLEIAVQTGTKPGDRKTIEMALASEGVTRTRGLRERAAELIREELEKQVTKRETE